MATSAAHRKYSLEEYLRLEPSPTVKLEYAAGQVYAMSGGSPEHAVYAANLARLLGNQLADRPFRVQSSDARISIAARDLYTYADLSVVCGPAELAARDPHSVVNPCLIVEVLSPGTEDYDRGDKLASYQQIPALREVLFVAHDAQRLELVYRAPDGTWAQRSAGPGEELRLELGCSLPVDEVYRDRTRA